MKKLILLLIISFLWVNIKGQSSDNESWSILMIYLKKQMLFPPAEEKNYRQRRDDLKNQLEFYIKNKNKDSILLIKKQIQELDNIYNP